MISKRKMFLQQWFLEKSTKNRPKKKSTDEKKFKKTLNKTRFRIRQEAIDAISFANVKIKLIYDKRHKPFMLKSRDKTFFIFNKDYKLFEKINKKLFQQKNDFFVMKKRMRKMIYEFELLSSWKIHFVISITQLKSHKRQNFYEKSRPDHSESIEIEKNIFHVKFYEIEKIVDKRIRKFEKIEAVQYLIRWKEYDPE